MHFALFKNFEWGIVRLEGCRSSISNDVAGTGVVSLASGVVLVAGESWIVINY